MDEEEKRITIANALLDVARAIRRNNLPEFLDNLLASEAETERQLLTRETIVRTCSFVATTTTEDALERRRKTAFKGGFGHVKSL